MKNIRVVLVEPSVSGNIGFVGRCMKNFDLDNLYIVNPSVDIDNESYRYAMHAENILKSIKTVKTLKDATKNCDIVVGTSAVDPHEYDLLRVSITPKEFAKKISDVLQNIALVFGRESTGLTTDELKSMDFVVRIPTSFEYRAMNVSHATAILFYEIFSQNRRYSNMRATSEQKRLLFEYIECIVYRIKYFKEYRKEKVIKAFKNVINRSIISNMEFHKLVGLFRSIYMNLIEKD